MHASEPTAPRGDDSSSRFVDAMLKMGFHRTERPSVLARLDELSSAPARVLLHELPESDAPVVRAAERAGEVFPGSRYHVLGEIARGGVGRVLQGRDTDLGRDIAIKVLRDDQADNPEMVRRFVEEAQIGGQLQHPGVLPVHELGLRTDRRPYFTMKLVRGQTLASVLAARVGRPDGLSHVLGLYLQVCQAVAYAHARGVVHRDLKPTNVLVGSFGEVHVTDWGLAKVLAHGATEEERSAPQHEPPIETLRTAASGTASLVGSVLGTPAYMPPEQACGEVDEIDRRSDVFGLGAILCEVLTGRPPYDGTDVEVRERARQGDLEAAHRRLASCGADPELIDLATACLATAKAERPADAGMVVKAIEAYLEARDERTRRAEVEAAEARVEARGARRARRLALGLAISATAVAALVVAGTIGWIVLEGRQRRQRTAQLANLRTAIDEASRRQAAAEATTPSAVEPWERALLAAQNAAAQLRDGVPPEMAERAAALEREANTALAAARTDTERRAGNAVILAALEACRFERPHPTDRVRHGTTAAILAAQGIDVLGGDETDVVSALAGRGEHLQIALGFDAWAAHAPPDARARLLQIAGALDSDSTRQRLRDAVLRRDGRAIEDMVRAPSLLDQPRESISLVVATYMNLRALGAGDGAVDYELLEKTLRAALSRHPVDGWLNWHMAEVLMHQPHRIDEALQFAQVISARGNTPAAWYELGRRLLVEGHYDKALTWLEIIERRQNYYAAEALRGQGKLDEALALYEAAERAEPGAFRPPLRQGLVHYALGNLRSALAAFQRAAASPELDDKHLRHLRLDALNFAGAVLSLGGRDGEAIAAYRRCMQIDESHVRSWENFAVTLERAGDWSGALDLWRYGGARVLYLRKPLVRLLLDSDLPGEALDHARGLTEESKGSEEYSLLAEALEANDELQQAVEAEERALDLSLDGDERTKRSTALERGRRLLRLSGSWEAIASGELVPEGFEDLEAAARLCDLRREPTVGGRLWLAALERFPDRVQAVNESFVKSAVTTFLRAAAAAGEPVAAAAWRDTARSWLDVRHAKLEAALQPGRRELFAQGPELELLWHRDTPRWSTVRGKGIEALPTAERAAWRRVWERVDALLRRIWDVRWAQ